MVRLKVIRSGSQGNCYVLESCGESILLECGVKVGEISKALKYDYGNVAGCVVSHRHGDHIDGKTARALAQKGVPVYGREGIFDGMKYDCNGLVEEKPLRVRFDVGRWGVCLYPVPHGECPNAAMLLFAPSGERILFATDLSRLPYVFKGVNYMMIEANYSDDVRMERTMDNEVIRSQSMYHMEIGETKKAISAHLSDVLRYVVLLHPSRYLINPMAAKSAIKMILRNRGVSANVDVAERGLDVEMDMYPF